MKQGAAVPSLTEVQKRFLAWRQSKTPGSAIPAELWEAAVTLSERISPARVAKELGLNYSDLGKHIAARGTGVAKGEPPPLPFLEMPVPTSASSPACLVEMQNRQGDTLRIYLAANQPLDLVALGQAFWGTGP